MNATTASALLADDHWHGGWGPWFLFFPLFWLLFVVLVIFILRRTAWRRGWHGPYGGPWAHDRQSPLAVLGERYARGEIDEEEYRARKATLTEESGPAGPR
ncbi:SHOCT domain-containing protein [Kitasatospora sp. LaBMicrA B282]|uniref:SHOCT domain-containing protein n=1 Tax=Kitasatospora sp. LaBMicrA B282 TaxID=3420949 RepID=UPI003D0D4366